MKHFIQPKYNDMGQHTRLLIASMKKSSLKCSEYMQQKIFSVKINGGVIRFNPGSTCANYI